MRDLLSYDVEISDEIPEDVKNIQEFAPFHISVAATVIYEGASRLWLSRDENGTPTLVATPGRMLDLLHYLDAEIERGVRVCAWNGVNFDLRWIGHQAGDMKLAAQVALRSFDPMFQFFVQRGFPIALAKVIEGMKLPGGKLMHGADAPKAWRDGKFEEVMEYVKGDCDLTNTVVVAILERKILSWVTAKGKRRVERMHPLKTVEECLAAPMPDQSWMDDPKSRESFCGWIQEALDGS